MSSADLNARSSDLRWPSSLGFKLMLVLLLLLAALGGGAYYASQFVMQQGLDADIRSFEENDARRLASELDSLTQRVESTAAMLGELALNSVGGSLLRPAPPLLLEKQNLAGVISAVGIWPEPNSVDRARDRASLYWVTGASGKLEPRNDYNDPRAVPYYREAWYTPARYATPGRCYWTPAYHEPLARRDLVSCSMPMAGAESFAGVVTLSLELAQINKMLDAAGAENGYSLLVDSQGKILGASPAALPVIDKDGRPRNFAELAQRLPAFNSLALALHRQSEALRQAASGNPGVRSADIVALKTATREFSSADADRVLTHLRLTGTAGNHTPERIELPQDAVLQRRAVANVLQLPASGWTLIRILPAGRGLLGARQLFAQTMALAGALALALLILMLAAVRLTVIGPLKNTVKRLAAAGASDDPLKVVLDEAPRNELGALAFWINERARQLRDHVDRVTAGQLQLSIEAKERRAQIEQLGRFQDRSHAALQASADALIIADENNLVEDVNTAAEQLLGTALSAIRGRPLSDVLQAQSSTSDVTAATAALTAMQRGARLDPREDFVLKNGPGEGRPVRLSAVPIRGRSNRISGVVLVLRDIGTLPAAATTAPATTRAAVSLPGRDACEKRTGDYIVASRKQARRHCLLVVDLDRLRRINEIAGRSAGDEAIARLADTLTGHTGSTGEVFHLHADRYALLLPSTDSERALAFAGALRESAANLRVGGGARSQGLTISIGIDEFGGEANAGDALLRAEDACAAAKQAGRNMVKVYDSSMVRAERDANDATWVRRVRAGLDQNMLHLSTQYVASSTTIAGAWFESLLSLEDEEGFWSPATAFMPAAERHGLAATVDRWHINNICSQLMKGEMLRRVASISVLISQSSVIDSQLPDFLAALMEKHKPLAGRLSVMLSEASLQAYPNQAQHLMEVMRKANIVCVVSDFLGRDPGILQLLRQLPADYLRMDARRFRNIGADPAEQKFADAVLQLARSLQKRSWIYGIDEIGHLETWRRLNADLYQGNSIGKASPVLFQVPR